MESEKAAMIISPYALPVHAKKPAELPEYRGEGLVHHIAVAEGIKPEIASAAHQRERRSSTPNVKTSPDVSSKENLKNEAEEIGDKPVEEVPIMTSNDEKKQNSGSQRKDVTGLNRGMNPQTKSKSDQVPLLLLEEKEQEILAKDETIQILNAKIKRMEHLLHLKDIRIEDLQARLEVSRPTGKR